MKNKRRIMAFLLVAMLALGLTFGAMTLMRHENPLERAARNADTINIVANFDHARNVLVAQQTVYYTNRSDVDKPQVQFHIYANAYRQDARFPAVCCHDHDQAFPNGVSHGWITVERVYAGGELRPVTKTGADETVLVVALVNYLQPGQTIAIQINYVVQLANIRHRLGWTNRAVNLGNFYPVPVVFADGRWQVRNYSSNGDPFFNAVHNFNVTLTASREFTLASSGVVTRVTEQGATITTHLYAKAIRDFAIVLSRYFQHMSRIVGGVVVNYYWLDDTNPTHSLNTAVEALAKFSKWFVAFPYRHLSVVQTEFLHGGMEYGKLVMISVDVTDRHEMDRVIVHEIAHQWWYGLVGNDQSMTAWVDEGLAEYSTMLFFDEHPDFEFNQRQFIQTMRYRLAAFRESHMTMQRELNLFVSAYEYVYMVYVQGLLLFYDLERMVGRTTMKAALRDFAYTHKFGIATPSCLVQSIEKTTNARLGLWFQNYVFGVAG